MKTIFLRKDSPSSRMTGTLSSDASLHIDECCHYNPGGQGIGGRRQAGIVRAPRQPGGNEAVMSAATHKIRVLAAGPAL